ncbi:NADP-dependent oxidoreductase, partial [Escherichia coli]|nr:NADP-dependent oxidoreductase [Escherichia coli]
TVYLSLDPYMRGRMSDAESYAEPVALDDVMIGGTVCQVEASNHPGYEAGEWVLAYTVGWQDYAISTGEMVIKLGKEPQNPSYALGVA